MKKYLLTGLALIVGACLLQWGISSKNESEANQEIAMNTDSDASAMPALTTVTGEVLSINMIKRTSPQGQEIAMVTLNVKKSDNETSHLVLGPAEFVNSKIKSLQVGSQISAEVFKPKGVKMAKAFVVKSLNFQDNTVELRDSNLRPLWAADKAPAQSSSNTQPE